MVTLPKMSLPKFVLISTIFLNGCGANFYSVHRVDTLDHDRPAVISVDAKQRFLLSNVISKKTKTGEVSTPPEMLRRYCAEPSPDVFSALGQAVSLGGSFGQKADPASLNIALQGAFSSSETAATISRTQTINMLKEMMYRTCERFLNGQIGDFEYPIIAARDQRIMTSILAIEQLTGILLQKPVVIASTGSASAGQATSEAILSLDNANNKVAEKNKASEAAQAEFDKIDVPRGICKQLMDKKPEPTATDEKAKLSECKVKQDNIKIARDELKEAKAHYDHIASLAGKPGVSSASTSAHLLSLSPTTEADIQIEKDRTTRIAAVSSAVMEIVLQSFVQDDETAFFCYSALNRGDMKVEASCMKFLLAKVEKEAARLMS